MTSGRLLLSCAAALAAVVAGCSSADGSAGGATAASSPGAAVVPSPGITAADAPSQARYAPRACAAAAIKRLTLPEQAGQLFLTGIPVSGLSSATAQQIAAAHLGSVLLGGDSGAGVRRIRQITMAVRRAATTKEIRPFIAANQEGGEIQPLRGPGFGVIPPATVQGTLATATLEHDAERWAAQLRAAGVNLDLAPVLDTVPYGTASGNAPIGALRREYGSDPVQVARHGVAVIDGMRAAGVATTAKHFPGLGRVRGNTDFTPDVTDARTTARDPYLIPYQAAINAGVPFVMVSLATYTKIDPRHIAAFSAVVNRTLLRARMRFGGVIISDDLGAAAAVAAVPAGERAIAFLNAGGDMITSQDTAVAAEMAAAVTAEARGSKGFLARIHDAVLSVLTAKAEYGLLPC